MSSRLVLARCSPDFGTCDSGFAPATPIASRARVCERRRLSMRRPWVLTIAGVALLAGGWVARGRLAPRLLASRIAVATGLDASSGTVAASRVRCTGLRLASAPERWPIVADRVIVVEGNGS